MHVQANRMYKVLQQFKLGPTSAMCTRGVLMRGGGMRLSRATKTDPEKGDRESNAAGRRS